MKRFVVGLLVCACLFSVLSAKEWKIDGLTVTSSCEWLDKGYGTADKPLPIVIRDDGNLNRYLSFEMKPSADYATTPSNQVRFLPRGRHDSVTLGFQYDLIPWEQPKLLSLKFTAEQDKNKVIQVDLWVVKTASLPGQTGTPPQEGIQAKIEAIRTALQELELLIKAP